MRAVSSEASLASLFVRGVVYCNDASSKEGDLSVSSTEYMTVSELQREYPISADTGIDALLWLVEPEYRDSATIAFITDTGYELPYDPRVCMEDQE